MVYFWLALVILLSLIELVTPQLITLWFAGGALLAMVCALFGLHLWLQITVFILSSVILLILTRPLYLKLVTQKSEPTNLDRLIGQVAVLTEDVDNLENRGTAKIMGQVWTARSLTGEPIPAGEKVTVRSIEGVKLIVTKL